MKPTIVKVFVLLVLVIPGTFFYSCKRDKLEPYFGPQSCPGDDFSVVSEFKTNKDEAATVNFTLQDSLYFTASFTTEARWTILIEGKNSHATKVMEGFSKTIDTAWYGRSGSDLFFLSEPITVKFEIVCKPELSRRLSFNMVKSNFEYDPLLFPVTFYNGGDGVYPGGTSYYSAQDAVYGDGNLDSTWCPFSSRCTAYQPSQEGGGYHKFIGIAPIPGGPDKNIYGAQEIYFNLTTTNISNNPDKVWLNFLANTEGTPVKMIVSFINGDNGDRYGRKVFSIKSNEWGLYSVNLGALEKAPTDITVFSTKDVNLIVITLVQSEGIAPTYLNMDFLNFTEGSAFY